MATHWRRKRFHIKPQFAFWALIAHLVGVSVYFTYEVELRRRNLKGVGNAAKIASGAVVEPVKAIDGDEVSVKTGGTPTVIRILGIKSFSATANERTIQSVGAAAWREADKLMRADPGPLIVTYKTYKQDKRGRTLAYLERGKIDIGLRLVEKGLVLVFTRYPFSRQATYLAAEAKARAQELGLWGDPKTTLRALALKAVWEANQ